MKISQLFLLLCIIGSDVSGLAQKKIDQAFVFPPGSGFRKYSIYEPSAISTISSVKVMIGFHPYGTEWDAKSWRDTLINLCENNDLLLVCPDGGQNGRIDEQTDYEFTEALIDSILTWYAVDEKHIFGIGYSEGGKAVYEYGLRHKSTFRGFIVMGAMIDGTDFVKDDLPNAHCKNYFLIHGDNDSPGKRYYPIRDSLEANGANMNSVLLAGVGHTYNFPGREVFLQQAFTFVDTMSCDVTGIITHDHPEVMITSNFLRRGDVVEITLTSPERNKNGFVQIVNLQGVLLTEKIQIGQSPVQISTTSLSPGMYIVVVDIYNRQSTSRIVIF